MRSRILDQIRRVIAPAEKWHTHTYSYRVLFCIVPMQKSLYKKQQNNNRIIEQCVTHARWRILTCASHLSRNRRFTFNCSQQRFSLSLCMYIYMKIYLEAHKQMAYTRKILTAALHMNSTFWYWLIASHIFYYFCAVCPPSLFVLFAFCLIKKHRLCFAGCRVGITNEHNDRCDPKPNAPPAPPASVAHLPPFPGDVTHRIAHYETQNKDINYKF